MYTKEDQLLAQKLLDHSTELESGQNIMLQLIGLNGIGLMRALVEEVRKRDANPFIRIEDTEVNRLMLENGTPDFWKHIAAVDQLPLMRQMDAFVGIRASENIYENSDVSKEENSAYSKHFLTPVHYEERVEKTNWVVLRYPSSAFAMNAKMPTEKFRDFYYKACIFDYESLQHAMKPLEELLRKTDMIQLKGGNRYRIFRKRPELDSMLWETKYPRWRTVFISHSRFCKWADHLCPLSFPGQAV